MDKMPVNAIRDTVRSLLWQHAYRATKYLDKQTVVKATRRHKINGRARTTEIVVTFGYPNYAEREFIKKCKKAGEPFPVKKIQLKFTVGKRG